MNNILQYKGFVGSIEYSGIGVTGTLNTGEGVVVYDV